ncbi:MAG: gluconokinase [Aggregatilineales bacterium]
MVMLIIDVGSSSLRVLLMDADATPVPDAIARREYRFDRDKRGKAVANPQMLRELLEDCIDEILLHPCADAINAVGMATFVSNFLGVDNSNTPLTALMTYGDTRSTDDIDKLRETLDEDSVHQRTGCMLHTAYYPGQMQYLKRTMPDTYKDVAIWIDFATYCYRVWFGGDVPMGVSVASWSGLLNRHTLQWDDTLCTTLNVARETLPDIDDMHATQQGLREIYAARWKKLRDVPFFLAVGDGAAANVGSGAMDAAHLAVTIGTTAAVRIMDGQIPERVPDGLWQYRVDNAYTLTGGATGEGGNLYAWVRKTLHLPDETMLEAALLNNEPGVHGLTVLPLFAGERSPGWRIDAAGTLHGVTLSTTPVDMVQALQESLAINLARVAERLHLTADVRVMAGGAAVMKSSALQGMLANAFDRTIFVPDVQEVTARGVAILIQVQRGQGDFADFRPGDAVIVQPKQERVQMMQGLRAQQEALYQRLYG